MEYRLALTMQSEGDFYGNNSSLNLLNTPSVDYVNPGLGQITQLFDLYVPIHSHNTPFTLEKIDNNVSEQIGNGLVNDNNIVKNDDIVKDSDNKESDVTDILNLQESVPKDLNALSNSKINTNENIKKKLDEGIFESFQHPKVKIGKIILQKSKSEKSKSKIHKFSII